MYALSRIFNYKQPQNTLGLLFWILFGLLQYNHYKENIVKIHQQKFKSNCLA